MAVPDSGSETIDGGYEDVYNIKEEIPLFDEDGMAIFDPDKMDEEFFAQANKSLDSDFGMAIETALMSQNDVFQDLESSLEALTLLDELAEKDEAISRIYNPPPTLISYANRKRMQIGGSTCVFSMSIGRSITMVPELKREQMWGIFVEGLEGNAQIDEFEAMEEIFIENEGQLENLLQTAFIKIRQENRVFLGLIDIEGNGFERNVFDELELEEKDIDRLMEIHEKLRTSIEFPELSADKDIEVRYYGRSEAIEFLSNPRSQGLLDIAQDTIEDEKYSKGIINGIICVDEEAVYFFILSDNLQNLDSIEESLPIDQDNLAKMYERIDKAGFTPVSWFRMSFGFRSFDKLEHWEDMKEGVIVRLIMDTITLKRWLRAKREKMICGQK